MPSASVPGHDRGRRIGCDRHDLQGRDFAADRPGVKFVGDITYICTWAGFIYLATVIDCYSKKVAGWSIADHMRTELV